MIAVQELIFVSVPSSDDESDKSSITDPKPSSVKSRLSESTTCIPRSANSISADFSGPALLDPEPEGDREAGQKVVTTVSSCCCLLETGSSPFLARARARRRRTALLHFTKMPPNAGNPQQQQKMIATPVTTYKETQQYLGVTSRKIIAKRKKYTTQSKVGRSYEIINLTYRRKIQP